MPSIDVTLPYRGKLTRLERFISARDGQERVRIFGAANAIMEPPGLEELFDWVGFPRGSGEIVTMQTVEEVDDGEASVQRITGPQALIDALAASMVGLTHQGIRAALRARAGERAAEQARSEGKGAGEVASLRAAARAAAMPDVDRTTLEVVDLRPRKVL